MVQRRQAQRTKPEPLQPLVRERVLELKRCGYARHLSQRGHKPDALIAEAPKRDLQDPGRGEVEPLHVVESDDHRTALRKRLQHVEQGEPDEARVWRFPARLGEQKGNHDLVRALEALARKGRRFNFVVCGGGHPARIAAFLEALAGAEALRARSWLFPFIAQWKVPGFIAACDLVAFLERDFPISFHAPRVPREVLSVGTALLCSLEISSKQAFDERLADRENYLNAGDPKETGKLAEAIDFGLADRARLKAIGAAGRRLLAQYEDAAPEDPIIPALQTAGLL